LIGSDFEAVIFDLDDTLYPEREYVISGFKATSFLIEQRFGFEQAYVLERLIEMFDAGVRGRNFDLFLDEQGVTFAPEQILDLILAYRKHEPDIALPKISEKVLHKLKGRFKLGLLTDGYLETQQRKVIKLGLDKIISVIVYSDEWGREFWKPNRKAFEEASRLLGIEPSKCIYIADNPEKDFKGAKECGMSCIQLQHWVDRSNDTLESEFQADMVVESLEILSTRICELAQQ